MDKILVSVRTMNRGIFLFACVPHFSDSPAKQRIEPEFYKKWHPKKQVPEGAHYELELVHHPLEPEGIKLHIHLTPSGHSFVCYTNDVPTVEEAAKVFRMWAAGSTFTILHKEPFDTILFDECRGNIDAFLKLLEVEHGIEVVENT